MRNYYRNIIFKVILGIAFIVVILIELDYILSIHGFYSVLVVLGFVWVWEQLTKTKL